MKTTLKTIYILAKSKIEDVFAVFDFHIGWLIFSSLIFSLENYRFKLSEVEFLSKRYYLG